MDDKSEIVTKVQKYICKTFQKESDYYAKNGLQLTFRVKNLKRKRRYLLVTIQPMQLSKSRAIRTGKIKIFVFNAELLFTALQQSDAHAWIMREVEKCLKKDLSRFNKHSVDKYFKTRYIEMLIHPIRFYRYLSVYKAYYGVLALAWEFIYTAAVIIILIMTAIVESDIMSHLRDVLGIR